MISRRQFNQGLITLAFAGLSRHLVAAPSHQVDEKLSKGYGKLLNDPAGLLDLPAEFSYRVISSLNDKMTDGLNVPDRADGMGCFYVDSERVALIRNHELSPKHLTNTTNINYDPEKLKLAYDTLQNKQPLPGGTSTIIYNHKQQRVEHQFMSLSGTVRNCSGGITPWGTWLTCEESVLKANNSLSKDHGYVFEVPANTRTMVKATPIIAMGRFNHEAACVDPRTGIVYMTEDRDDSLLYRFIPHEKNNLHAGGQLQALMVSKHPKLDTRNWDKISIQKNQSMAVNWIDLEEPQSPKDDLRLRGYSAGAAIFARGEGIHWGNNELYFCCTSGGAKKIGQIMRYVPSVMEGSDKELIAPGKLSLFVESKNKASLNFGDNITVAPNNHLIVCEDQYTAQVNNHLKGVTPTGHTYDFARIRLQTEPAGACFSPDGTILFVNLYSPSTTLAITGPWEKFKN